MPKPPTQLDKFKTAAKQLECDDGEAKFDEKLRKIISKKKPKA